MDWNSQGMLNLQAFLRLRNLKPQSKGKAKVHPITGHEDP